MQGVPITVPVPPQVPPEESCILWSREGVETLGFGNPKTELVGAPKLGLGTPKTEPGAPELGFGTPKWSWEPWGWGLAPQNRQEPKGWGSESLQQSWECWGWGLVL